MASRIRIVCPEANRLALDIGSGDIRESGVFGRKIAGVGIFLRTELVPNPVIHGQHYVEIGRAFNHKRQEQSGDCLFII